MFNVVLISRALASLSALEKELQTFGEFHLRRMGEPEGALGALYDDPPHLILLDLRELESEAVNLTAQIKGDFYFNLVPLVGLMGSEDVRDVNWEDLPLDDFLIVSPVPPDLKQRLLLSLKRTNRILDNNPLSRLPGNTSIQRSLEESLGKSLIVAYVDINDFKPFNDKFGFAAGDEVILILARLLANRVRDRISNGFVGHVGGDDFVFIAPASDAVSLSEEIIEHFDGIMKDFFKEGISESGTYQGEDREGRFLEILLPGIAIALVPADLPGLKHIGQIVAYAADMKKAAKNINGSAYALFGETEA